MSNITTVIFCEISVTHTETITLNTLHRPDIGYGRQ